MEQDFLLSLLMIIGIDLVLGGDNAILIAMASRNLPEKQRNKAILLGTFLAIVFRIVLTSMAVYLLDIPFLECFAGIFLLYIAFQLMSGGNDHHEDIKGSATIMQTVKTIVIADLLMGLDNVIAIAGASHGQLQLVVIGLFISIPIIIWGSKFILKLLDRFPALIYIGGGMLAYTGGGMIADENKLAPIFSSLPLMEMSIPYLTTAFMLTASLLFQNSRKPKYE
ncbi:YjbE family putative metal transport protein [Bacillus lacus]|uniref:YjbE family putative metal transport protein n=1 Tax=Metabacillus lacus TaxID=1983721 RepID=A0A7X2J1W5_9BACI|nr:TerC family protein [Metabacillus lacus]MRX73617.1 YjbE family putative metal transport protein [Metabacillus lacus]